VKDFGRQKAVEEVTDFGRCAAQNAAWMLDAWVRGYEAGEELASAQP
jgi:hypothetical protein